LGKVTDIQIDDSISFVKTADGRVVASSTPGYVSYHITLEATGVQVISEELSLTEWTIR